MKRMRVKTYKFGKYTITKLPDEIIFIINGKEEVKMHSFRNKHFPHLKKFAIITLIALISVPLIFSYSTSETAKISSSSKLSGKLSGNKGGFYNLKDENEKNKILLSNKTDFTKPKKNIKLYIQKHRVVKGDSISTIAKKFGVSMGTVYGSNSLHPGKVLRVGVELSIPNKDGILYTMKKGDRLLNVARKYRSSVKKILSQNYLINPDFIPNGKMLFIPDAKTKVLVPGFIWPTGSRRITCRYGWRKNPFNRRRREFHSGLDLKVRYGWIRATKYGKVAYSGWMGGYGKVIVVAHPGGWKSLYAHLSKRIVRKGQYVKQGQLLGKSGNTGRSTGPHLHFEIIKYGKHKNPLYMLRKFGRRYKYL